MTKHLNRPIVNKQGRRMIMPLLNLKKTTLKKIVGLARILVLALMTTAATAESFLLLNARVYTMTDKDAPGLSDILLRDGRIVAIAPAPALRNTAKSAGAERIDLQDKIVTPGFIAPRSSLGIIEIELLEETRDDSTTRYQAGFSPLGGFNPDSTLIPHARAGGITLAQILPRMTDHSVFAGLGSIVALDTDGKSLVKEENLLLARFGGESDDSRGSTLDFFRDSFTEAKEWAKDPNAWNRSGRVSEFGLKVRDLSALEAVRLGRKLFMVEVHKKSDILALLDFVQGTSIRLVLSGASEAHLASEQIAAANVPVILDATDNIADNFDELTASLDAPRILYEAGVTFAFGRPAFDSALALRNRQSAGVAVAYGLPQEAALAALTSNVADIFGLKDAGRIAPGHRGDLVVWNADPLQVTTWPELVFINGKPQPITTRSDRLRKRYLEKSERPYSYVGLDAP